MPITQHQKIKLASALDLDNFFVYLIDHLSDNWSDEANLFLPMSRDESRLDDAMKDRFSIGINTPVGEPGWRRLMLALNENKTIVGHIDIRSHPEKHTSHRALLGMGVDRSFRRKGIGENLIREMTQWMLHNTSIEYLDLRVLSNNNAAKNLYIRSGFELQGEIVDMFRIEAFSLSYALMSRRII